MILAEYMGLIVLILHSTLNCADLGVESSH